MRRHGLKIKLRARVRVPKMRYRDKGRREPITWTMDEYIREFEKLNHLVLTKRETGKD